MISFYKNGDTMGIETDCKDEREFLEGVSETFSSMIAEGRFMAEDLLKAESLEEIPEIAKKINIASPKNLYGNDWAFQLNYWLPQIVDICCKYRGYKSAVAEKRLLIAGAGMFAGCKLEGYLP